MFLNFKVKSIEFNIIYEFQKWISKKTEKGIIDTNKLGEKTKGFALI